MKVKALIPVYGSNRMNASRVGELLKGCSFVGIPFAGGLCEVPHIEARTVVANDLNRAAMNLASVVSHERLGDKFRKQMNGLAFHPDTLATAQTICRDRETTGVQRTFDFPWAASYFICAWMARNGTAGTDGEFKAGLSIRWEAGGGDSVVRFRNATEALADWHDTLKRCTFQTLDAFDFLAKCQDRKGHGYYCDPPWPDDGDGYKHKFDWVEQRRLAKVLSKYHHARVVLRYGDHSLIRELYPESDWTWVRFDGRTQTNASKREVLIVNGREAT